MLTLLKAPGLSSNRTSTTFSFEYHVSILRPPPARNSVSPGSTLLRQRQNTGCGWSPVFATARSAWWDSSAARRRWIRSDGRNGESQGLVATRSWVASDRPRCSPAQSAAVSAIPGVAFSGSVDGHLRAFAARDGAIVWDFDTVRAYETVNKVPARGGSLNGPGPAIAGGMLFVNSGYAPNGIPGNVLLAFSVDGQ